MTLQIASLVKKRNGKDSFTFERDPNGQVTKVKDHVNGVERTKHMIRQTVSQVQQIAEVEKLTGHITTKQTVRQKN